MGFVCCVESCLFVRVLVCGGVLCLVFLFLVGLFLFCCPVVFFSVLVVFFFCVYMFILFMGWVVVGLLFLGGECVIWCLVVMLVVFVLCLFL